MFLVSLIYSESPNLASRRREDAKRSNPGQENGWGEVFPIGPLRSALQSRDYLPSTDEVTQVHGHTQSLILPQIEKRQNKWAKEDLKPSPRGDPGFVES
jgi:hypothetical protein